MQTHRLIQACSHSRMLLWIAALCAAFADYLTAELNRACNNKPLSQGELAGVHVAAYAIWPDGDRRPVVYHIHNGHLSYLAMPRIGGVVDGKPVAVAVDVTLQTQPRKLFEKHPDLPNPALPLTENLKKLEEGYVTHNGGCFFSQFYGHISGRP